MAKFKNGNLVLTASQSIIQGSITIDEFVTTLGTTDTKVPTEGAVSTYVDGKISGSIITGVDQQLAKYSGTDSIAATGVLLSTDGTFAADSDAKVPTEKAIKTYVDTKISGSISTGTDRAVAIYDGTTNLAASAVTIDASGNTSIGGNLTVTGTTKAESAFYAGTTMPDSTARLNFDGEMYASKFWNAVWNDIVDFQNVIGEMVPGKCYFDTLQGARICTERCQKSVIGILSDTYGMALGRDPKNKQAPFAVAGWVLAYMSNDDKYEPGDALTNDENGCLVKMRESEKAIYPERIIAIYKKPEIRDYWGPENSKIRVSGRHWVKVK